jgi:ABC-type multidrug transport system fused ATPase/permease subunit
MIKKLWKHIANRRKKQVFLLLILMVVASILEIVSIGAVVPFLGALTSPEQVYQHQLAQPLLQILEITEPSQLLTPLTIIFIIATLAAAGVRLLLLYASTRLSYAVGGDLSIDIFRRTLYQDYSVHVSRNSSDVINSIITKTTAIIGGVLFPLLNLASSVFIMVGIASIIFTINTQIALITLSIFALFYGIIAFFTRKSLQKNSKLIADKSTQMIKSLQEGLGGIRDVLIDSSQEFYCKLYQTSDSSYRRAAGSNVFIGASPRFLMEGVGMMLIAILAYSLSTQQGGMAAATPILGALAISAQKLLPAFQQAYRSYSAIKGAKASFGDVLDLLDQQWQHNVNHDLKNVMPFNHEIVLKDLSFRYTKDTPWILKNVNLRFLKGETVGFVGVTGSGKSTLLDILMGLLAPTSGEILIDGVATSQENLGAWQAHISHVPQNIFLADSTIEENIAFGIVPEKIKEHKVAQTAQQAQISETIDSLKNKYKTLVGERGVQLSGGQRQRVGIARALYKDSDVLIFDEATSALDNETEQQIMQQIAQLEDNKTIFIIAHRLSTLKQCDHIIRINSDFTIEKLRFHQINSN